MNKIWIDAVYDRTYGSVQDVAFNPDQENPKGCWNASDLNRIENNIAYCAEYMYEQKIVHTPIQINGAPFEKWTEDMIPTKIQIDRILNNIRLLIELSSNNPDIANQLPTIYAATQINYILANSIEYALDVMHNQPRPSSEYREISVEHGVVHSITRLDGEIEIIDKSSALAAEDEIVIITAIPYGDDADSLEFRYWTGDPEDVDHLIWYSSQTARFTMPYGKNVHFSAYFVTRLPRTLTLTDAYISPNQDPTAEDGPETGVYHTGDVVMIIADIAPKNKEFYEWVGTKEALDHLERYKK